MEMPTSPFGNTSSIQVVWQAPVPPHGVITDYDISYVHVDGNMNATTVRLSASNIQDRLAYLITDLLSDSTYSIKVRQVKQTVGLSRIISSPLLSDPII